MAKKGKKGKKKGKGGEDGGGEGGGGGEKPSADGPLSVTESILSFQYVHTAETYQILKYCHNNFLHLNH